MMFLVQVGRYKSAYKTKWSFDTLSQASLWYKSLNIGNGYKKRLINPEGKVVSRYIS